MVSEEVEEKLEIAEEKLTKSVMTARAHFLLKVDAVYEQLATQRLASGFFSWRGIVDNKREVIFYDQTLTLTLALTLTLTRTRTLTLTRTRTRTRTRTLTRWPTRTSRGGARSRARGRPESDRAARRRVAWSQ